VDPNTFSHFLYWIMRT